LFTLDYHHIEVTFCGGEATTYITPRTSPDLPTTVACGVQWNPCTLPGRTAAYIYIVAAQAGEDPYTHVKLLNGNWYCIEAYEYQGDLFWITQEDWLIDSASTLHPANFTSSTVYHPSTTSLEPVQQNKSENSGESSEADNEQIN
jgi:hypothetical protein